MKLHYELTLEQSQKLIMTPELRQAIQLLQYNSLELNEYISKELEENPMLEIDSPIDGVENVEIVAQDKDIDWKEYLQKFDDISYKPEIDRNQKEYSFESFVSYIPSLKENLIEQLNLINMSPRESEIGEYIIQNIDNNGYLVTSIEEIAEHISSSTQEIENILSIIQTFEPMGVGARNLKECLLLQIKDYNDPFLVHLIEHHLEDIGSNRMQKISKEEGISLEELQVYCDRIKRLEPKPGRIFNGNMDDVKYIIPDATIHFVDGEYIIIINDSTGPRLNINNFYKNLIKDGGDLETTEFLQDKYNSAMWIIRSIEQRRQTIYKVIESILKFQIDFFKDGEKSLVPLTLKDIAEDIDMHESTISRATNGKYVQTHRGLFELKYFFTTGLHSTVGEISSTSVKSIIKGIIESEDVKKPYSDQQISNILEKKGMKVSRRTVAKYRDELEIPSSSLRRRY